MTHRERQPVELGPARFGDAGKEAVHVDVHHRSTLGALGVGIPAICRHRRIVDDTRLHQLLQSRLPAPDEVEPRGAIERLDKVRIIPGRLWRPLQQMTLFPQPLGDRLRPHQPLPTTRAPPFRRPKRQSPLPGPARPRSLQHVRTHMQQFLCPDALSNPLGTNEGRRVPLLLERLHLGVGQVAADDVRHRRPVIVVLKRSTVHVHESTKLRVRRIGQPVDVDRHALEQMGECRVVHDGQRGALGELLVQLSNLELHICAKRPVMMQLRLLLWRSSLSFVRNLLLDPDLSPRRRLARLQEEPERVRVLLLHAPVHPLSFFHGLCNLNLNLKKSIDFSSRGRSSE